MSWWMWIVLAVLVVFGWYLSSTAGRLDRLHRRVDAGRVSLDRALVERGSTSSEVGAALLPDPASAVVISDAAQAARRAGDDELERSLAESNLTQVLAAAFDVPEAVAECASVPGGRELLAELDSATRRVQMSRRFLNDAVRACRDLRYQWIVRVFRLAGRTPWPQSFEMDDAPPSGFGVR